MSVVGAGEGRGLIERKDKCFEILSPCFELFGMVMEMGNKLDLLSRIYSTH